MNKIRIFGISTIIFASFALVFGPFNNVQAAALEVPALNYYQMSFVGTNDNPSATIDSSGNVYVTYERDGSIYFKMNRGYEELVANGHSPSLAVDSSGDVHIVYLSGNNVMYAVLIDGVWENSIVASGDFATIDVASGGEVHIAYSSVSGGYSSIYHAVGGVNGFTNTIIKQGELEEDVLEKNYIKPNIKVDNNGNYHIAFIYTNNAGDGESYIEIKTDGIDGDSNSGVFSANLVTLGKNSLSLDNSGNAHIVFYQDASLLGPSKIMYAKVTNTASWEEDTVVTGGGSQPAIFVDGSDIGIVYRSSDNVVYRDYSGGSSVQTVDSGSSNPVLLQGSIYVYYQKAGQIWLATDREILDTEPPVVSGVEDGGLYNDSRIITFSDNASIPTATLNGEPFFSGDEVSDDGDYVLEVVDECDNQVVINFSIDTNPPFINGVEDGETYSSPVTITFGDDEGEVTYSLTGPSDVDFKSGDTLSTNGFWTLSVDDLAGNNTTVNFTINIITRRSGGGGGTVIIPIELELGDINGDGKVDEYDFAIMMSQWGQTGDNLSADLNNDGKVDEYDFAILMANWGL
ncbi:MAG TPA: hypothetical protein ENN31_02170 [Candidatus Vogelbacteria bacterium]|nr:hypothetical protein [Candidatus Vogelbacteria bacterium]